MCAAAAFTLQSPRSLPLEGCASLANLGEVVVRELERHALARLAAGEGCAGWGVLVTAGGVGVLLVCRGQETVAGKASA